MKWKMVALVTAGSMMIAPTLASACDTVLGFRPWHLNAKSANAGLEIVPGSDGGDTGFVFTGDFTIPVGEKAAVAPLLGYCKFGDFGEIVLGAGGAVNVFNNADGTVALNVQMAVSHDSYEGGSEQSIPIGVAGSYAASETASIIFGGGLAAYRFTFDTGTMNVSNTSWDPFATAGAEFETESARFFAQLALRLYDSGTDTVINLGAGIPVG